MSVEKRPAKRMNRRTFFLRGSALLGAAALAAAALKYDELIAAAKGLAGEPEPAQPPVETQPLTKEVTKEGAGVAKSSEVPTKALEPTPKPKEVVHIGMGSVGRLVEEWEQIGGGEPIVVASITPEVEPKKGIPPFTEKITQYVAEVQGLKKEISRENLTEPRNAFFATVAEGTYAGFEGVYSSHSGEIRLLRLGIEELPVGRKEWSGGRGTRPENFAVFPGTFMTIVGRYTDEQGVERFILAFEDWLRRDEEAEAPRIFVAGVPLGSDGENEGAFTLIGLLAQTKATYNRKTGEIEFENDEKWIGCKIEKFKEEEGASLIRDLEGLFFVSRLDGELAKNPIVPYPPEELKLPAYWEAQRKVKEDGEIFISIEGGESVDGELKEIAQARYDGVKGVWVWQSVESDFILELDKAPQVEGLKAYLEGDKIIYRAESGNLYGLEAGVYAGEIVSYTLNQKPESGVGLIPPVLEVLVKKHQTLEALKEKGEKFPLPFDPRGMEFEMEEIGFPFVPKATGKERLVNYLGLRLPLGTVVYCPVLGGELGGSERMIFLYDHELWSFPTLEDEKELGEKCLNEGFCSIEKVRTGEEIVERINVVVIRAEKPTFEITYAISPFFILFSQKSMVVNEGNVSWENRKEAFLGKKLFTVDSEEPAQKYTAPTDYPILIRARRKITNFDSLYKIDDRYVFILPLSGMFT